MPLGGSSTSPRGARIEASEPLSNELRRPSDMRQASGSGVWRSRSVSTQVWSLIELVAHGSEVAGARFGPNRDEVDYAVSTGKGIAQMAFVRDETRSCSDTAALRIVSTVPSSALCREHCPRSARSCPSSRRRFECHRG